MKASYKNKRDQYKAERDDFERRALRAERELKAKQEDIAKRYIATVYCTNCMTVSSINIPPGLAINEGDCVVCRVRKCLLPVSRVNANRTSP